MFKKKNREEKKREKKADICPSLISVVIANKMHALYCYEGQICPLVKLRAAEMREKNIMTHKMLNLFTFPSLVSLRQ